MLGIKKKMKSQTEHNIEFFQEKLDKAFEIFTEINLKIKEETGFGCQDIKSDLVSASQSAIKDYVYSNMTVFQFFVLTNVSFITDQLYLFKDFLNKENLKLAKNKKKDFDSLMDLIKNSK